jgi:hypothetical protein
VFEYYAGLLPRILMAGQVIVQEGRAASRIPCTPVPEELVSIQTSRCERFHRGIADLRDNLLRSGARRGMAVVAACVSPPGPVAVTPLRG